MRRMRRAYYDAVTCSHAFYEIKGGTRNWVLQETIRVLKPKGAFLMMEHDVPPNPYCAGSVLPPPRLHRRRTDHYLPSP